MAVVSESPKLVPTAWRQVEGAARVLMSGFGLKTRV